MTSKRDPISVLHVDDDPSLADLVSTFLEREDDRSTVITETEPRFFERLNKAQFKD